jgi:hypothetical protein
VRDALGGDPGDEDDGWLRTGGMAASQEAKVRDVQTLDESGKVGEIEEEEEIPDMEDEEDDEEAIIRDTKTTGSSSRYGIPTKPQRYRDTDNAPALCEHTPSTSPTHPTTAPRASISPVTSLHQNRSHHKQ